MQPRPRIDLGVLVASCLAVAVALLGCDGPDGSTDTGQVPPADDQAPASEDPATETPARAEDEAQAEEAIEGPARGEEVTGVEQHGPSVPPLHPAIDDLPEAVVTIITDEGSEVRIDAKVAATSEHRRRGLMEVAELPEGTGMLFLFEEERTGGFWMWNTLVPLDIAYVAADGVIVDILAMDPCEEDEASACPSYQPDDAYVAAIEVPQGWFAWQGVAPGDHVRWTQPTS